MELKAETESIQKQLAETVANEKGLSDTEQKSADGKRLSQMLDVIQKKMKVVEEAVGNFPVNLRSS